MYLYLNINDNNFYDENDKIIKILKLNKKINLFVGENNSGKSRFIKQILSEKNKCISFNEIRIKDNINSYIDRVASSIDKYYNYGSYNKSDFEKELLRINDSTEKIYYMFKYASDNNIEIPESYLMDLLRATNQRMYNSSDKVKYIPILRGNENFDVYFPSKERLYNIQMTIPQHNDFESYLSTAKTIYKNKVSNVYRINSNIIFTGEELYDEIVDILLGEETKREKFHSFEKFVDEMFYERKGFQINPSKSKKCLQVKIGNEKEYEIHNMGEGIKQLITILYPIYMRKDDECTFFIEEPEINLHPGFQRKLMEILIDNFPNHRYFITTHSNHIIDIINFCEDVSLYKFKKKDKKIIMEELDKSFITALSELGVNASASMLANCTIWVEGISDRIYLKKYIEMCFKNRNKENKFKEGIHYSFVEYGGANITHWNFDEDNDNTNQINVKYLNNNTFLIVDNDGTGNKTNKNGSIPQKELRKQELRKILNERFFELKSREIENLIKLEVLEKTLKLDNNLNELKRKKYIDDVWTKKFNQSLISTPYLSMGSFIDETYILNKNYKDGNSNTIRSKAEFANKICKNISSWDDLSEQAQELADIVCDFIEKNN